MTGTKSSPILLQGQEIAAQDRHRLRSRGKWPGLWESFAVLCMALVFTFSFSLSSPVNGLFPTDAFPREVFEQDSKYFIDALAKGKHFKWNPQHHLLYHVVTEGVYNNAVRPHVDHGFETAYMFLKGFAVLTGTAFMIVLSRVLWEMGLPLLPRILLLLLTGVSVTAWFNFSAIEAHSLAMAGIALYILALLRLSRFGRFRLQEQLMLGVSLTFMFLCRLDLVRFFVATALLIPLPHYRAHWRRLGLVLATAFLAGGLLYLPLTSMYFKVPLSDAPKTLLHRDDPGRLQGVVGTRHNLTASNLARMSMATTISTVIMPVGPGKFREPLAGVTTHPMFAVTLIWYVVVLFQVASATWKDRKSGGPFVAGILVNWGVGLGLYTWFNPGEPFIWLLEFLPLLMVLMGNGLSQGDFKKWVPIGIGTLLILVHNIMYFFLPYRIYH
jgi:hypothetical protein